MSKKCPPLTKYVTIAPNLEINEVRFRNIDPSLQADSLYKNGIDRSRNVMGALKNEGRVALTQGLHFISL